MIWLVEGGENMYLFKCKCGALFTVKKLGGRHLVCPDCRETYPITSYSDQSEIESERTKSGLDVRIIPDDAKITVTFDT